MAANPAMVVRIAANLAELKKNLAEGKSQIEVTSAAMQKLATSLNGDKLIQSAHNIVAAVNQVGGASKLTESEKARLNVTLQKAIDKYQMLGKEAPAAMRQLAADTTATGATTDGLRDKAMKAGAALMAMVSVAAITNAVRSYADFTGKIADLSAKTGIGTEALQRLKYAAEQNGATIEQVTGAVIKLGGNLVGGNKSAVGALDALGLSMKNVRAMEPDKAFTTIADAIAKVPDPMDRSKLAMDLFGKAGADLLPMMTGNLSETAAAADRLGLVLSDEAVKAGDEFGDTMDTLMKVGQAVIAQMLTPMIPVLTKVAQWLGDGVPKAINGTRAAFDWIVKKGLEAKLAFEQFVLGVVELGAKVPWLGAKLGATSAVIEDMRRSVQLSKDTITAFDLQTKKVGDTTAKTSGSLKTLNLDYAANGEASKAATKELEKLEQSLERVRLGHYRLSESAVAVSNNVLGFKIRISEVVPISTDYSRQLQDLQIKKDGLGRAITVNLNPSLKGLGGQLAQNELRLAATGSKVKTLDTTLGTLAETFSQLGNISGGSLGKVARDIGTTIVAMKLAGDAGKAMKEGLQQGGVEGYAKVATGALAAAGAIDAATNSTSKAKNVMAGAATGAKAGAQAFGVWGAAIGAVAGALVGLWKSNTHEGKYVSPLRDAFFEAAGGLEVLNPKVVQLTGNLKLVEAIFKAKTVDEYNLAIKRLNEAFEFQGKALQTVADTAQKYNLTIQEMGPAFARQELDKKAQELFKDYEILISAGVENVTVISKMSASVNEYVKNALTMGAEVPIAMKPMLEAMAQQGLLTDAAGNKITDLENSGVSFAMTMSEGFKALIDEVQKLTDAIARGLGLSLNTVDKQLRSNGQTWEAWSAKAENAVEGVDEALAGLNFGHSPGGIKEIPILLSASVRAFDKFGDSAERVLRGVDGTLAKTAKNLGKLVVPPWIAKLDPNLIKDMHQNLERDLALLRAPDEQTKERLRLQFDKQDEIAELNENREKLGASYGVLRGLIDQKYALLFNQQQGFEEGTKGRFLDFGKGTNVTLHGKERVVTAAEGRAEAMSTAAMEGRLQSIEQLLRDQPRAFGIVLKEANASRRGRAA